MTLDFVHFIVVAPDKQYDCTMISAGGDKHDWGIKIVKLLSPREGDHQHCHCGNIFIEKCTCWTLIHWSKFPSSNFTNNYSEIDGIWCKLCHSSEASEYHSGVNELKGWNWINFLGEMEAVWKSVQSY